MTVRTPLPSATCQCRRLLFGSGDLMSDDKKTDLEQRIVECQQKIEELSLSQDDPNSERLRLGKFIGIDHLQVRSWLSTARPISMGSFREWPRLLNTEKNCIVSDASFAWSASDEDAAIASDAHEQKLNDLTSPLYSDTTTPEVREILIETCKSAIEQLRRDIEDDENES